jgi:protein gp37
VHSEQVPAAVRFLSIEPLLGPIPRLPLRVIDWVIVGGESGPKAREMKVEWIRSIRDKYITYDIPFFFKQWGVLENQKGDGNSTVYCVTSSSIPRSGAMLKSR